MRIVAVHQLGLANASHIYVDEYARALAHYGDEITLVAPHEGELRLLNGRKPFYDVIGVHFNGGWLDREVKRRVCQLNPDIIHVWSPRELASRVALELFVATGAPLVVNYEDPEHLYFEAASGPLKSEQILRHFDKPFVTSTDVEGFVSELNWHVVLENLTKIDKFAFLHPLFFGLLNRCASGFTGICRQWVELLRQRFRKPTLWMPLAVDFARLEQHRTGTSNVRRELDIADDAFLMLQTGTVYPFGNSIDVTLYGVADFVRRHSNSVFVLCGYNHQAERTKELVRELGLQAHVRLLGFLDTERYHGLLAEADVALCPGFPDDFNRYRIAAKIVEYMILGKPMICYGSGIGEDLVDGQDALLLVPFTPEHLAEQLTRAFEDPELRTRLGANARLRAREWFDVHPLAKRMHDFYARLLPTAPAAPVAGPDPLVHLLPPIISRLQHDDVRRVALYGAGKHTTRLLAVSDLAPLEIVCIVDDEPHSDRIDRYPVVRPSEIGKYPIDAVLLSSDTVEELLAARAETWVPEGVKIVSIYQADP